MMNNHVKKEVNIKELIGVKDNSFLALDHNNSNASFVRNDQKSLLLNSLVDNNVSQLQLLGYGRHNNNNNSMQRDSLKHVKLEDILQDDSFD